MKVVRISIEEIRTSIEESYISIENSGKAKLWSRASRVGWHI